MLPPTFRFTAYNKLGVTAGAGAITITARFWKRSFDGSITWSNEIAIFTNASLANLTLSAEDTYDNTAQKYEGGVFMVTIAAPTGSSGDVIIYFDPSTNSGTTYPTPGAGYVVASLNFTTTATKSISFNI